MRFTIVQRFPGELLDVEAALVEPAFIERLAALPKLGQPELLQQREEGHLLHQRVHYAFAGELSSAVRKVVDPDRLTWIEESTLDRRTHRTTWRIIPDFYGSLLRCGGTFHLSPDGDGQTRRTTEAEIRVTFPLVGGRVERAIVSGLEEHAALEERVMAEWLSG